jgi:hypothetical protein
LSQSVKNDNPESLFTLQGVLDKIKFIVDPKEIKIVTYFAGEKQRQLGKYLESSDGVSSRSWTLPS